MIACDKCKTENLDGSQYCDECGASLKPVVRSIMPSLSDSQESSNGQNRSVSGSLIEPEFAAGQPAGAFKVSSALSPAPKPDAWLVIERGPSAGKQFAIGDKESQIGRWDAEAGIFPDVDLDAYDPEAKVSRRHARITVRDSQFFVEDLGSTNGTFVNRGKRLLPGHQQALNDGDEIIVGKTFLRFRIVK